MPPSQTWKSRIEFPTIISPLCFSICWIIALCTYDTRDWLFVYAVIDLVVSIIVIAVQLFTSFENIANVFGLLAVILLICGMFMFSAVVGMNLFELSGNADFLWNSYPLLVRVAFVQLWIRFILFSFVLLYFITAVAIAIQKKRNGTRQHMGSRASRTSTPSVIAKTGQRIARYTLPYEEAQLTVTKFHDWLYKNDCTICGGPLDDQVEEFKCKHKAHQRCVPLTEKNENNLCQRCMIDLQERNQEGECSSSIRLHDMFGA